MLTTLLPLLALAGAPVGQPPPADPLRFDASAVDKSVAPCSDFYAYACNGWRQSNPLPPDRSVWDPYYQLEQKNDEAVRSILEARAPGSDPDYRKVTTFYAACMDEAGVEKAGLAGLSDELRGIKAIHQASGTVAAVASIHTLGEDAVFSFYSSPDLEDSRSVIGTLGLSWLGMRDRDDYLKDDEKTVKLREAYRTHVERMLELSGVVESPRAGADAVLRLETEMARVRPTREQRRDPRSEYHKLTRAQLDALTPGWPWQAYLEAVGAPPIDRIIVTSPESLSAAIRAWLSLKPDEQQAYLIWHAMHGVAPALPARVVEENFHFYGTVMRGTQELQPRWKRCGNLTDEALGEAIGKVYVQGHFAAATKQHVLEEIAAIRGALRDDISSLSWLGAATRQEALAKLDAFRVKVGYPDHWRDYSALEIKPGDFLGDAIRASRFEFRRTIAKIGKPVDREEWFSLPQEVDGYQSSTGVEILFTAGMLQPPFFDPGMDDAVNYGAIGRAMGHELTHGFDDDGRKFDLHGNLRDWWTSQDGARFEERAQCFVDEYSHFVAVDDKMMNGRLTLGENIADNGGIRLAYAALEKQLQGQPRPSIEGLTPEQRFFLAFARTQCVNVTDATERDRLLSDPHSPGRWRVNGTVQNFPAFQAAFACKAGDPMVSAHPCRIW